MEYLKSKSIKKVGLIVVLFSGLVIFSNAMGALTWSAWGSKELKDLQGDSSDPIFFLFDNYFEMCLVMILIGVLYLIGGLAIRKYRLWANRLVTGISVLLILVIWGLMVLLSILASQNKGMDVFGIIAIIIAIIWSAPIVILIRFLNKQKTIIHFR